MYAKYFKRLFDFVGALLLLPFVVLEIIVLAPFIWFTDKGPIFYNADRLGIRGTHFKMFKLRSMYVNSEDIRNADGSTFNSYTDPRVTPIGRFMRSTSLDEFPQFLNVLIGDMSFIGPRPTVGHIDYENSTGDKKHRYDVKPGVTGYAQAYFRNAISQDEKFHWDAYYAENVSFKLDVKIILHTIGIVLLRKNVFNNNKLR